MNKEEKEVGLVRSIKKAISKHTRLLTKKASKRKSDRRIITFRNLSEIEKQRDKYNDLWRYIKKEKDLTSLENGNFWDKEIKALNNKSEENCEKKIKLQSLRKYQLYNVDTVADNDHDALVPNNTNLNKKKGKAKTPNNLVINTQDLGNNSSPTSSEENSGDTTRVNTPADLLNNEENDYFSLNENSNEIPSEQKKKGKFFSFWRKGNTNNPEFTKETNEKLAKAEELHRWLASERKKELKELNSRLEHLLKIVGSSEEELITWWKSNGAGDVNIREKFNQKNREINILLRENELARQQIQKETQRLHKLERKNKNLELSLNNLRSGDNLLIENFKKEIREKEQKITELDDRLKHLEKVIGLSEKETLDWEKDESTGLSIIEAVEKRKEEYNEKIDNLQVELEKEKAIQEEIWKEAWNQVGELEAEITTQRANSKDKNRTIGFWRGQAHDYQQQVTDLQRTTIELQQKLSQYKNSWTSHLSELAKQNKGALYKFATFGTLALAAGSTTRQVYNNIQQVPSLALNSTNTSGLTGNNCNWQNQQINWQNNRQIWKDLEANHNLVVANQASQDLWQDLKQLNTTLTMERDARPNINNEEYQQLLNNQKPVNLPDNWKEQLVRIPSLEQRPNITITTEQWESDYQYRPTQVEFDNIKTNLTKVLGERNIAHTNSTELAVQLNTTVTELNAIKTNLNQWTNQFSSQNATQVQDSITNLTKAKESVEAERDARPNITIISYNNLVQARNTANTLITNTKTKLNTNNLDDLPQLPLGETLASLLARPTQDKLTDAVEAKKNKYQRFIDPQDLDSVKKAGLKTQTDLKDAVEAETNNYVDFINPNDTTKIEQAAAKLGFVNFQTYRTNWINPANNTAIRDAGIATGLVVPATHKAGFIDPANLESEAKKNGMKTAAEVATAVKVVQDNLDQANRNLSEKATFIDPTNATAVAMAGLKPGNYVNPVNYIAKTTVANDYLLKSEVTKDHLLKNDTAAIEAAAKTMMDLKSADYRHDWINPNDLESEASEKGMFSAQDYQKLETERNNYQINLTNLGIENISDWQVEVQSWKTAAENWTTLADKLKNQTNLETTNWPETNINSDDSPVNRKFHETKQENSNKQNNNGWGDFIQLIIGGSAIYSLGSKEAQKKVGQLESELEDKQEEYENELDDKNNEIYRLNTEKVQIQTATQAANQKLAQDYQQLESDKNNKITAINNLLTIEKQNYQLIASELQHEKAARAAEKINSDKEIADLKLSADKYKGDWEKERDLRAEKEQEISNLKTELDARPDITKQEWSDTQTEITDLKNQLNDKDAKIHSLEAERTNWQTEKEKIKLEESQRINTCHCPQELNNSLGLNLPHQEVNLSQAINIIKELIAKPPTIIDNTQHQEHQKAIQNPLEFLNTVKQEDLEWLKGVLSQKLYTIAREKINNQDLASYSQLVEMRNELIKEQFSQSDNKFQMVSQENNSLVRQKNILWLLLAIGLLGVAILTGKLRNSQHRNKKSAQNNKSIKEELEAMRKEMRIFMSTILKRGDS